MKNLTSIFAIVILLAALTYVTYHVKNVVDKSEDFKEAFNVSFEAYPNVLSTASRSENTEITELDKIMALYESKEYKNLVKEINSYLESHPDRYQLKFYRGIAYLETNKTGYAAKDFQDVLLMNDELTDQAEWYLGLAYLKMGDKESTYEIFSRIAESGNTYSAKANDALAMLDYAPDVDVEKYYRITDEANYEFIYWAEQNPQAHPVTERTLFLETSRQGLIPDDMSYYDFVKLTVPEKQDLLMNAQQETLAAIENSNRDVFAEIGGSAQPDANALASLQDRLKERQAEEERQAQLATEAAELADEDVELQSAELDALETTPEEIALQQDTNETEQTQASYEQPREIPEDLKLPWVVNVMLRPEKGIEVPVDKLVINKNEKSDMSWVIKTVTDPNAPID